MSKVDFLVFTLCFIWNNVRNFLLSQLDTIELTFEHNRKKALAYYFMQFQILTGIIALKTIALIAFALVCKSFHFHIQ